MRIVSNRDREFYEHLRSKVRPLLILADAEEQIAALLFEVAQDAICLAADQSMREVIRSAQQAMNAVKRKMAMDVAEGLKR